MLIEAGVSIAAVSRYMGHSNVSTTLSIYIHALAGTEADDAATVDHYLSTWA